LEWDRYFKRLLQVGSYNKTLSIPNSLLVVAIVFISQEKVTFLEYQDVIQGNIDVHAIEAPLYDAIHYEVWNKTEQKRLQNFLADAIAQIKDNKWQALDFGAGTGNLTGKLLKLGFSVTAVDISEEMCQILRKKYFDFLKNGKLKVFCLNIDETKLPGNYDFVGCYSVLHHMPNVGKTTKQLAALVKDGGVLYIDHEHSGIFVEMGHISKLIWMGYWFFNRSFEAAWLKAHGINLPPIDYSKADVNCNFDWREVTSVLEEENFSIIQKDDYFAHGTRFTTMLDLLLQFIVGKYDCCLKAVK
jgi:SAM-dependent methyltransferase